MKLEHVDARVKLLLLICLSTCAVALSAPGRLFTLAALCLLMLIAGGVSAARIARQTRNVVLMVAPLFVLQCLFQRSGAPALRLGGITLITWGGLGAGLSVAGRMLVILLSALMLMTGKPRDYLLAMLQSRMPYELAFMVMAAMRFVPLLREEAQHVYCAVQMRGAKVRGATVQEKLGIYASILLPVTAGALRRAEQMSVAMEARGFRSRPQRTYMRRLRMRRTDWAWLLAPTLSILAVALL